MSTCIFKKGATLNSHELAWAAGFYDGEGHSSFKRAKRHKDRQRTWYRCIVLEVSQKTPELLHRFKRAVGVGKVYGPYRNGATGSNALHEAYRFMISSIGDIEHVKKLLWPYLGGVKRKQLKQAISGWKNDPRMVVGRKPKA